MKRAKIGIKRYIKIALEHRDVMKRYEKSETFFAHELADVERSMDRFALAVEAVGHHDIFEIRKAEREAGLEDEYCAFY